MLWRRSWSNKKTSEKCAAISDAAYRLWDYMIISADDYGRLDADPDSVKWNCAPRTHWTTKEVQALITELRRVGLLVIWKDTSGRDVIELSKFREMQPPGQGKHRMRSQFTPSSEPREITEQVQTSETGCNTVHQTDADADTDTDRHRQSVPTVLPQQRAEPAVTATTDPLLALLAQTEPFRATGPEGNRIAFPWHKYAKWAKATRAAYTRFAIDDEIKKAAAWCIANSERAPRRDYKRFLTTWFNKADEQARKGFTSSVSVRRNGDAGEIKRVITDKRLQKLWDNRQTIFFNSGFKPQLAYEHADIARRMHAISGGNVPRSLDEFTKLFNECSNDARANSGDVY